MTGTELMRNDTDGVEKDGGLHFFFCTVEEVREVMEVKEGT